MTFPIDDWALQAQEVVARLYPPEGGRDPEPVDAFKELDPELNRLIKTIARGRHYANPEVDLATRTLCTISCLISLGATDEAETWIANALRVGVSRTQITAIISQLSVYVGVPKLVRGFEAARTAFAREDERTATSFQGGGQSTAPRDHVTDQDE
jgi:4-carboxymuconolactone decarboxylase